MTEDNATLNLLTWKVGGCVRDTMLGQQPQEQDWVVVGETPEAMLKRGFKQVGADFPVFLHPKTQEEYALARTEQKIGKGYKGFCVNAAPIIQLEEDLARRDLTINAMAMNAQGQLIDPFGGQQDLDNKILRHVSPAFAEDPLRVLRVARFYACFSSLGFVIHPETMQLMTNLVLANELSNLTPERVWQETVKALETPSPADYFRTLNQCGALEVVFPELTKLQGQTHSPLYHPEGDAFEHSLLTLEHATRLTKDPTIRFATLTHDLGKGATPQEELPHHFDHAQHGTAIVKNLCDRLRVSKPYKDLAVQVATHHMRCHRVLEMRPGKVVALLENLNAFRQPEKLERFLLACTADAFVKRTFYPAGETLQACLQAALMVRAKPWLESGLQGIQLGERVRQERIRQVKKILIERRKNPAISLNLNGMHVPD